MNKNNSASESYVKDESFMIFLHGKLRDPVNILKVIAVGQFSYILNLFHVTLYLVKALWKFKSFILAEKPLPVLILIEYKKFTM